MVYAPTAQELATPRPHAPSKQELATPLPQCRSRTRARLPCVCVSGVLPSQWAAEVSAFRRAAPPRLILGSAAAAQTLAVERAACVVFDGAASEAAPRAARTLSLSSLDACAAHTPRGCSRLERRQLRLDLRAAVVLELSSLCNLWHALRELAPQERRLRAAGLAPLGGSLYVNASATERNGTRACARVAEGILHFFRGISPRPLRTDAASETCPRCHSALVRLKAPLKALGREYEAWTRLRAPVPQYQGFIESVIHGNELQRQPRSASQPLEVLILTRHGDSRRFLNERELETALPSICEKGTYGVRLLCTMADASNWTMAEQMSAAVRSDILMGAHGAGLTWAGFMRPHSVVVEITHQSSGRCLGDYVAIAQMSGVHHVCATMPHGPIDPSCNRPRGRCTNFRVHVGRFERMLSDAVRLRLNVNVHRQPMELGDSLIAP